MDEQLVSVSPVHMSRVSLNFEALLSFLQKLLTSLSLLQQNLLMKVCTHYFLFSVLGKGTSVLIISVPNTRDDLHFLLAQDFGTVLCFLCLSTVFYIRLSVNSWSLFTRHIIA